MLCLKFGQYGEIGKGDDSVPIFKTNWQTMTYNCVVVVLLKQSHTNNGNIKEDVYRRS